MQLKFLLFILFVGTNFPIFSQGEFDSVKKLLNENKFLLAQRFLKENLNDSELGKLYLRHRSHRLAVSAA